MDRTRQLQEAEEQLAKQAELAASAPAQDEDDGAPQSLRTRAEKAEAEAGARSR